MSHEAVPKFLIRNLETGAETLLDVDAARQVATTFSLYLDQLNDLEEFQRMRSPGAGAKFPNEHGEIYVAYTTGDERAGPLLGF